MALFTKILTINSVRKRKLTISFLFTKILTKFLSAIFVVTLRTPLPSLKCKKNTRTSKIIVVREKKINMAAFIILFENERALRRERVFRDREHPLDKFSDTELISRYRFPRHTIIELTDLIKDRVQHPTARSHAIPPH